MSGMIEAFNTTTTIVSAHRGVVLPEARCHRHRRTGDGLLHLLVHPAQAPTSVSDFPYIPLEAKGWRMAMGLRPLDLDRWLEVDARRGDELEQKRRLLDPPTTWSWRRIPKATKGAANCSPK